LKRIISVSRRTDIPAFYGKWFLNRLNEGCVGYLNPFSNDKYKVSLKKEDVECFVFWSKNFIPFIDKLKIINSQGYKFYFNYTINGYSKIFEQHTESTEKLIDNLKLLSELYSQNHINWRYDPIIISEITDYNFHLRNFENIAKKIKGNTKRCIISFIDLYKKVEKNIKIIEEKYNVNIKDPVNNLKIQLANDLADIALTYGINIYSCCGDYLIGPKIKKAHCVDWGLIKQLFYNKVGTELNYKINPTRKECGCTESIDIGTYNTCVHGCMYCYANIDKKSAYNRYKNHDVNSVFLGFTKKESDKWINEMKER
jgi:hypothetical protein